MAYKLRSYESSLRVSLARGVGVRFLIRFRHKVPLKLGHLSHQYVLEDGTLKAPKGTLSKQHRNLPASPAYSTGLATKRGGIALMSESICFQGKVPCEVPGMQVSQWPRDSCHASLLAHSGTFARSRRVEEYTVHSNFSNLRKLAVEHAQIFGRGWLYLNPPCLNIRGTGLRANLTALVQEKRPPHASPRSAGYGQPSERMCARAWRVSVPSCVYVRAFGLYSCAKRVTLFRFHCQGIVRQGR